MRDVVIVGGGLTGLVAAYTLADYDVDVTLIEVKRHLGGSMQSVVQDNIIIDTTTFAIHPSFDNAWLESLGLSDALIRLNDNSVAFKAGTGSLITALVEKITATRLMRMAVSSIGELKNKRYSICMENGLMFDARSLILAVPARYAERMFYGYITPITETLLDYHYDTLHRVSLVCKTDDLPAQLVMPPNMIFTAAHHTDHPARVPDGYTLLQFGMRIEPDRLKTTDELVQFVCNHFKLPTPVTAYVGYWSEADPVSCYDDDHPERIQLIREQLPQGIALVGSDYSHLAPNYIGVTRLDDRIQQGIDAAHQVLATLA